MNPCFIGCFNVLWCRDVVTIETCPFMHQYKPSFLVLVRVTHARVQLYVDPEASLMMGPDTDDDQYYDVDAMDLSLTVPMRSLDLRGRGITSIAVGGLDCYTMVRPNTVALFQTLGISCRLY